MTTETKTLTPDTYRTVAEKFILTVLDGDVQHDDLCRYLDREYGRDGWTDEDCGKISDLIDSSTVTVTWPDDYVHWIARCRCGNPIGAATVQHHPTYELAREALVGWRPGFALEQITREQWAAEQPLFSIHREDCPAYPLTGDALAVKP